jgi:hypothetical protein
MSLQALSLRILNFLLLPALLFSVSCSAHSSFDSRLSDTVSPYRFSIARWEVSAISHEIKEFLSNDGGAASDQSQTVVEYFDIMARINSEQQAIEAITSGLTNGNLEEHREALISLEQKRDNLKEQAEQILEVQIRETLNYLDIYNPLDGILTLKSTFPPVKLRLEEPPKLLIISPRDTIGRLDTITLANDMSLEDITELETAVSELDVSALVVNLGGIATYPSFVANRYGLQFALSTAVEEWLHQYLFFRPLGFRYGMKEAGLDQPDYIATMNETLAGMVSDEIRDIIYDTYYAGYYAPAVLSDSSESGEDFDYNAFMRETRLTVDALLADGKIDEAEAYMEAQRLVLASHGYFIRKLNQAFFAFYGSYADQPGFENPIADILKALREQSATLADFLRLASGLTTPDELAEAIG